MYSPRIKERFISTLHHIARSENRKMTDIVGNFGTIRTAISEISRTLFSLRF